jgi:tetratricopeptide (TPR) repeat protein
MKSEALLQMPSSNPFRAPLLCLAPFLFGLCAPPLASTSSLQGTAATGRDLAAARSLAASGQFPEAIGAYREFLAGHPNNEAGALELAACYRRVHNEDQARRLLLEARRDHPQSSAAAKALGNFEIEAQSYDSAITALKAAVALDPADLEARNFLGSAYRSKGDTAAALRQFDYVLARDPQNGLALYLRAQLRADSGDDERAEGDAEKLLGVRPDYLPGRVLLVKVLIRRRQCPRAVEILRPPQNPPQLDSQALFLLANAYDCSGDAGSASGVREEFAAASQADRKQAENETQSKHLTEQANRLALENRFPEALDLLAQALEKDPRNGFADAQQAKIYFSMHDVGRAREAIEKALAIQPYQPDFLYVAGVIAESESQPARALRYFEQATEVNPKEADAFFEIGKIRLEQRDREGALAAFRMASALDPSDPDYRRAVESLARGTRP